MGLDNIPKEYPCKKHGTAVLIDDKIDCDATQASGGCPWMNAPDRPEKGRVLGMLGTDCWFRGKSGNMDIAQAGIEDEHGFYGDSDEGTEKSADSCLELASKIDAWLASHPDADTELVEGLSYGSWYLKWAAQECDGLVAWY